MLNFGSEFWYVLKRGDLYGGPSWTVVDSNLNSWLVGTTKPWGV